MIEARPYTPPEYIPNIIGEQDLINVPIDDLLVSGIYGIMTPRAVLEELEFAQPEIITPRLYPNFEALLQNREMIQTLRLLPVKTDAEYIRYHQQSKMQLMKMIESYFYDSSIAQAANLFPYFLPNDVKQYIIWTKNRYESDEEIAQFIAKSMKLLQLILDDVILFERPNRTAARFVKGSFPDYRHIHFWKRKMDI